MAGNKWDVINAVRADREMATVAYAIMLTLAAIAEVGTAEIPPQRTPSVTGLAAECKASRRTVQRHLEWLESRGWIIRHRPSQAQQWHGVRVKYQLVIPADVQPFNAAEGTPASPDNGVVSESRTGGGIETPGASQSRGGGVTESHQVRHSDTPNKDLDLKDKKINKKDDAALASPASPKSDSQSTKKGTRIPDDFAPSAETLQWARGYRSDLDFDEVTEAFCDYWRSKPGAAARKLDWQLTYKNWVRSSRGGPNTARSNAPRRVAEGKKCRTHRRIMNAEGECNLCVAHRTGARR